MAAQFPALGLAGRRLVRTYQKPPTATPAMIDVAQKTILLVVRIRQEIRAPESTDNIWFEDRVNEQLVHFVNFAENGIKRDKDELNALLDIFKAHFNNPEEMALLRRWVNLCGYQIVQIEGKVQVGEMPAAAIG